MSIRVRLRSSACNRCPVVLLANVLPGNGLSGLSGLLFVACFALLAPWAVSAAAAQTTREEQLAAEEAARAPLVTPPGSQPGERIISLFDGPVTTGVTASFGGLIPGANFNAGAAYTRFFGDTGSWTARGVYSIRQFATFRRDRLVVGEGARIRVGGSPPRAMTDRDVDRLLRLAARAADGSYRVLASRAVEGRPVGPFSYYGRRSDDPNDVVAHEHRRELRGLRVMAAWTQHVDSKGGNSLDTLIDDNGRKRVRHHLIDLGSTLGSAGIKPRDYNEGYESIFEPGLISRGILGFGFDIRPWRTIPYPDYPSIGRIESDHFEPDAWVPSVRNAAFLRARPDDLFWGARRVMAFTDEMIRAAVRTGQYSDPAAERYLASVLIGRRDRIGRAWLPIVNPIVDPALGVSGDLTFVNAAVAAGVANEPRGGYRAVWHRFDNTTGESTPLGESNSMRTTLPPPWPQSLPLDDGAYVRVDVNAIEPPHPSWSVPVRLYFRRLPDAWKLVGLERGEMLHTRDSPFTSSSDPLAMLHPWSCQSCNQGVFHDSIETSSALRVGDSFP